MVTPHVQFLRDAARYCVDNALYLLYNSTHTFAINVVEIQHLYLQSDGFLTEDAGQRGATVEPFVLYIFMDYTSVPYALFHFSFDTIIKKGGGHYDETG